MFRGDEIRALQRAADDQFVGRTLKISGVAGLGFGALALWAGVVPPAESALLVVGAVLAAVGLWNLTVRGRIGLLLAALALMVVGLYNLAGGLTGAEDAAGAPLMWLVVGSLQIAWGVRGIRWWRRFRDPRGAPSTPELRARVVELAKVLRAANPATEACVVVLRVSGLIPRTLRMWLTPSGVLCCSRAGEDLMFAERDRVSFEVGGAGAGARRDARSRSGELLGTLRAESRIWVGALTVEHAERLRHWQARDVSPAATWPSSDCSSGCARALRSPTLPSPEARNSRTGRAALS